MSQCNNLKPYYTVTCFSVSEPVEPEQPAAVVTLYDGLVEEEDKEVVKQLMRGKTRYDSLPKPRPTSVELYVCADSAGEYKANRAYDSLPKPRSSSVQV